MDKGGVLQEVVQQLSAVVMMLSLSCHFAEDRHDTGIDSGFLTLHFCSENEQNIK